MIVKYEQDDNRVTLSSSSVITNNELMSTVKKTGITKTRHTHTHKYSTKPIQNFIQKCYYLYAFFSKFHNFSFLNVKDTFIKLSKSYYQCG